MGVIASETNFDHWKVVFSWGKVRKTQFSQNSPVALFSIFCGDLWGNLTKKKGTILDPVIYLGFFSLLGSNGSTLSTMSTLSTLSNIWTLSTLSILSTLSTFSELSTIFTFLTVCQQCAKIVGSKLSRRAKTVHIIPYNWGGTFWWLMGSGSPIK